VPNQLNQNIITFRETACIDIVADTDACYEDDSCSDKYGCWDHGDGTIALTTTTFSFRSGTIYDADIEFNASPHFDGSSFLFTTVDGPPCDESAPSPACAASDIQNTLTHEIGHVVGLDHVDTVGSTMEPTAPTGEISKRSLDRGTEAGFCETYPPGAPSPPCDDAVTISRQVLAINKGTNTGCGVTGGAMPFLWMLALRYGLPRKRRAVQGS
jgi:hypothetical protein